MKEIRNVAIIAHVDHGKTTLVDKLLRMSGTFRENENVRERVMDSNDIERERGITILAKTTAIDYKNVRINILDTPGHADFGGEVERIMNMVDGVILVVDAYEGTMPQTRFVLKKALEASVTPIVVVNKIDKPTARPTEAIDEVLDLFIELGADEEQLDFPVIYASALSGTSSFDADISTQEETMAPILDTIINYIPAPKVELEGGLQFQPALLDYNDFVGRIGIGRVKRGCMKLGEMVTCVRRDGSTKNFRIAKIFGFLGLKRIEVDTASAGDIVAIAGLPDIEVGETICTMGKEEALPLLRIDEPTLQMTFGANSSPFGVVCEPYEELQIDVPEEYVGSVIEALGKREGTMENMSSHDNQVRLLYTIPSRGLIGFTTEFMTMTKGYGIMNHTYKEYRKMAGTTVGERTLGVLVSMENGKATAYALGGLEDRGTMFIEPGADVYEGMIVGEHTHNNDLAVNVVKGKNLTNTRSAGKDHTVVLKRPRKMSLEVCLDYINNDELVEVTPLNFRLRKRILNTEMRKKQNVRK